MQPTGRARRRAARTSKLRPPVTVPATWPENAARAPAASCGADDDADHVAHDPAPGVHEEVSGIPVAP